MVTVSRVHDVRRVARQTIEAPLLPSIRTQALLMRDKGVAISSSAKRFATVAKSYYVCSKAIVSSVVTLIPPLGLR